MDCIGGLMLTIKEGNTYAFVPTNAQRDENESDGIEMHDFDPFTGDAVLAFDGAEWLVPKMSVEPEPR